MHNYSSYYNENTRQVEHSRGGIAVKSILMFLYVYSFSIPGLPISITTNRVVALILFFIAIIKNNGRIVIGSGGASRLVARFWKWQIFLLLQALTLLAILGAGTGVNMVTHYLNMIIFLPITIYGMKELFNDVEELLKVLWIVTIAQSIIIVLGLIYPEFLNFINSTFNERMAWATAEGGGYEWMSTHGYAMGLACMTSVGSMQMSLGVVACSYFIICKKQKKLIYILSLILIAFATSAVSRTGLVTVAIAIVCITFAEKRKVAMKLINIVIIGIIISALAILAIQALNLGDDLYRMFFRFEDVFKQGLSDSFVSKYFGKVEGSTTVIPKISLETIIGTGIVQGMSGNGVYVFVDGGYLRSYVSMGLIVAVINYFLISKIILKGISSTRDLPTKMASILFAVFFAVGEFKEPFIYKYYFMIIVFLFFYCSEKRTVKKQERRWRSHL